MSINMDDGGISYSDHDVHHIRHDVQAKPGQGGDSVSSTVVKEFDITERGLDPDELAELRAMRVSIGAKVEAGEPQDSRGEFQFTIGAGYNINESDVISLASSTVDEFDPDADGVDEIRSISADTDEVGQIYTYADNFNIGFDDDTNGNGAGGNSSSNTEVLNMAELFGTGPYVDSADDFASVVVADIDNLIEKIGVAIRYSLYYKVDEVEGGRSRFGR